ncbi:hypothetical protein [Demequina sp.]|uniref:hypothetical protein n=1 Tax=Demequina sp. TaxID=2050685 RepID=UPI003A886A2E
MTEWRALTAVVLRRGWLAWCGGLFLVIEAWVLTLRGAPWRHDLVWTIDWFAISHILVGPIVAGAVAMDVARMTRGMREFPTRVTRSPVLLVGSTYAAVVGAIQVLMFALTTILWLPPGFSWAALLAMVAQCFMVVGFVGLGTACGAHLRVALAPIVAACAAVIVVTLTGSSGSSYSLFYAGGATVPRIGYAYDGAWLAVQVVALAVFVCVLTIVATRPYGRWPVTAVAAAAVAGMVGAAMASAWAPGERYMAVEREPTTCGGLVTVSWCYYPEHEWVMDSYAEHLIVLIESAREAGYDTLVPEVIEEASQVRWPADASTGVFYVSSDVLGGGASDLRQITSDLVSPLQCPQVQQDLPPSEQYWHDLEALVNTWVALAESYGTPTAPSPDEVLSPEDAGRLITEFRTCTHAF